jgi:hypothetical protein
MSKTTIVNRKFLEEQVKSVLKEVSVRDGMDDFFTRASSKDREKARETLLDIGPSILKDILETPVWLSTIGDRALFSGGSRARQALFKSDAPDDIKYFFNIYEVNPEEKLRLSNINNKNFIVSRDLLKVLDRVSGLSDLKDIYEELKDFYSDGFFGAGDISRMVLVSENSADQIIAVAKKKNIAKEEVIKLFFQRFFNEQYKKDKFLDEIEYKGSSISEYFEEDNILEQLNEKYKDDLGAFILYSSMDPAMTKSLEEWKETYRQIKEIEKANESQRPMNFTTLLLLVVGEGKLENKIENSFKNASRELAKEVPKKPVSRFFGSLFRGVLIAAAIYAVNEALDAAESTWGPSMLERLKIKESIMKAKRLAFTIAKDREYRFTSDDIDDIKKILMTPLKIIIDEFNQSTERSALNMTSKELASTFVNFQNSMEVLRNKVFDTTMDINNKEQYDKFIKSLDEHYKAFQEEYNKVRMPAKLFENQTKPKPNPLQLAQQKAKAKFYQMQAADKLDPKYMKPTGMIEFIADEISKLSGLQPFPIPGKSAPDEETTSAGDIKIRGILINKNELTRSGLTKEFILQLMTWYDLEGKDTRDVRFEAINEVAMQLKIFIKKQASGSAVLGKYNRQFTKKWRAFGRPLQSAFKTTQPAFVRKEYSGVGLLSEFISLGRLFKNNQRYTMVCAPMVWWLEDNSCLAIDETSNTEGIFQDLASRSSVLGKDARFDKFSDTVLFGEFAYYQKLKDTYSASLTAYKKVKSLPGNLRVILQTNIAVCGALIELEKALVKAEINAQKRFAEIDKSVQNSLGNTTAGSLGKDQKAARIVAVKAVRDEVGMIYAYVELYNRVEKLFLDNNIRFF